MLEIKGDIVDRGISLIMSITFLNIDLYRII